MLTNMYKQGVLLSIVYCSCQVRKNAATCIREIARHTPDLAKVRDRIPLGEHDLTVGCQRWWSSGYC